MKKTLIILSVLLAAAACGPKNVQTINVVPYPNEVQIKSGEFCVAGAGIKYDAAADERTKALIEAFAQQLSLVTGTESAVSEANGEIAFILDAEMPHEAYTLNVTKKGVEIKASGLNGFNYAIQTIKQMLPVEVFGKVAAAEKEWTLPCVKIDDAPRFGYRGLHMDVSRHFFDMDEVKRYLDIMEVHKLNTLHWHITDDQGWRLEIKKYPRLTEVGAVRKQTLVGHLFDSEVYDGTPYGEGCYFTQDQVREILDYAAGKGITVIPEIDLPGHMLAALAAYPELGCTGGPYDVWGKWGVADDVLCVGKEKTMQFLEDVLTEVCELFPAEYVHIGGDECPKVRWEKCPKCQAKIKELGLEDKNGFKAEHYLQSYVMNRMTSFLEKQGKKIIGWDEILEGEVADNAIVMSWRGTAGGIKAAQMGHDAIMTPNSFFYLDYYQSLDTAKEPLAIGGYLPVETCYSYEPYAENMTDEEKAHILGVQANLWTEYIATNEHLEYMLLPRMAALSEVQWCQPQTKSWERFLDSADDFCAIYDVAGYNYSKRIFDVRGSVSVENNQVLVHLEAQGDTPVRYTTDGTEPTEESALYEGPVAITGTCTFTAKAFRPGLDGALYKKDFNAHKAMAKDITVNAEPHKNYRGGLPYILIDGMRGPGDFHSKEWSGWRVEPFDIVLDMNGETYSSMTLSTTVVKYDDIFNPAYISVYTSDNGKDFTEVAKAEYPVEAESEPNGPKEYTLEFPETSSRYLKVVADAIPAKPDWHERPGSKGFLFIDEVIVK
ncbi:MAG: family 20 glycosylhydrolase [Bacteroidales bacterium]|nr:family 20 glycosylhydrolase [Bacteroidales bacterium]